MEQIQEQVQDADIKLFASKIAYKELERSQTKELNEKRSELQSVRQEIASVTDKANEAVELLGKINVFISSFRLFVPTIEEYANQVEADKTIEAGNSFRGILYEIGKLLETFKELIKEGLCWFPRLMRWKTSKGEVAPVFIEKSNGYSYSVYGYMNVETREYYSKVEGYKTVDVFFNEMLSEFRLKLANNIFANNSNMKLTIEQLNYYVQLIIDRIIFIRVCESKGIEEQELLKSYIVSR